MAEQLDSQATAVSPVSVQEFSKKVKEKYPEYKDVDDATLAKKIVEKYPEYKERVSFDQPEPVPTGPQTGTEPANPGQQPKISPTESLHSSLPYFNIEKKQVVPSIQEPKKDVSFDENAATKVGQENTVQNIIPQTKAPEEEYFNPAIRNTGGAKINSNQPEESLIFSSPEEEKLDLAKNILDRSKRQVDAVTGKGDNTGVGDALRDRNFWTLGSSDLSSMIYLKRISNKLESGEALSDGDKALLEAWNQSEQVNKQYPASEANIWYKTGKNVTDMIPWLVQFAATRGAGATARRGMELTLRENAEKYLGKTIASGLSKGAAEVAGAYAAAAFMPNTYADITRRSLGETYKDEKGNIQFDGESADNYAKAIYKGWTNGMLEVLTERLGEGVTEGLKLLPKNRFTSLLTGEAKGKVGKIFTDFTRSVGWDGAPLEYLEEWVNIPLNAMLVGDNKYSDMFDGQQQLETFLTVAAMGSAMGSVQYASNKYDAYRVNKDYKSAKNLFDNDIEESTRNTIESLTNGDLSVSELSQKLNGILSSMDGEKAGIVMNYVVQSMKYNNLKKTPITTATIEGQQYTINNPEDIGQEGKPIFAKDAEGNVTAVQNHKVENPVTQTLGEIDQANQQAAEQAKLYEGISDPNAQVTDDINENGIRLVKFNNGQSKIITSEGEIVANNQQEEDRILEAVVNGEPLPQPKTTEQGEVIQPAPEKKVISQKFGNTSIDIIENEGYDEIVPSEKVPLEKALPALEKKFKDNKKFKVVAEKVQVEEPGETKYDDPVKKTVIKSIRIVPLEPEEQVQTEKNKEIDQQNLIHNKVVNMVNDFNSLSDAARRKTNTSEIVKAASELGYNVKTDTSGKLIITDKGKNIGLRGRQKSAEEIESHPGLSDYQLEVQETAGYFMNPMSIQDIDFGGLQPLQVKQAILDIQAGKKTVNSNDLLDAIENIHNKGVVTFKANQKTGFTGAEIPLDEYKALMNEEDPAAENMTEEQADFILSLSDDELLTPEILNQLYYEITGQETTGIASSEVSTSETKVAEKSNLENQNQNLISEEKGNIAVNQQNINSENQESLPKNELQNEESEKSSPEDNSGAGQILSENQAQTPQEQGQGVNEGLEENVNAQNTDESTVPPVATISQTPGDSAPLSNETTKTEENIPEVSLESDQVQDVAGQESGQRPADKPQFRTLEKSYIQETIDELQAKAPSAAPVVIVQSLDDVPSVVRYSPGFSSKVEAFYYAGKVYIFPDMIRSRDHLINVWIHENGIHHGIKNIVSFRDMRLFMNKVYDSFRQIAKNNAEFQSIVDRISQDYPNATKQEMADEYLAYLAEKKVSESDLSPMEQTLWEKYLDMFRDFLRRLFNFDSNLLTEKQIIEITRFAVQSNFQQNELAGSNTRNGRGIRQRTSSDANGSERSAVMASGIQNEADRRGTSDIRSGRILDGNGTGLTISDQASEDLKSRHNALDAITRIGTELNIPVQVVNSSELTSDNNQLVFTDNGTVTIVSNRVKSVSEVIKALVKEVATTEGLREMLAGADPNSIIGKQLAKFDELSPEELQSDKLAQIIRKAFRLTSNQFTNEDLNEIINNQKEKQLNKNIRFRTEDQSQIIQDARRFLDFEDFVDAYQNADFRDSHSAPGNSQSELTVQERMDQGDDFNLAEVVQGFSTQPEDYFDPRNGARWYGYDDKEGMQSYFAIRSVMNDINSQIREKGEITKMPKIKAYRAVPKEVSENKLIDRDWITFSKEYAKGHGESRFGKGEYKIISQNVPADQVWWDGNDINEWGYDTGNTDKLYRNDLKKIWDEVHGETRFRIIGETGAANLDKAEEATTRLDNLAIAREMEQAGKDVKSILKATGWQRGIENSLFSGRTSQQALDYLESIGIIKKVPC